MKLMISCVLGLLCSTAVLAGEADLTATALRGSCQFEGQFASGCIDFAAGGKWDDASMQRFCQDKEKPGETAVVTSEGCKKDDFNALCASKQADGSVANIYVDNLPGFICKKYMKGVLVTRPDGGWQS